MMRWWVYILGVTALWILSPSWLLATTTNPSPSLQEPESKILGLEKREVRLQLDEGKTHIADWDWAIYADLIEGEAKNSNVNIKEEIHSFFYTNTYKLKLSEDGLKKLPKLLEDFIFLTFNKEEFQAGKKFPSPLGYSIRKYFTYDASKNEFVPRQPTIINKDSQPPMIQFFVEILDRFKYEKKENGEYRTPYGAMYARCSSLTFQNLFNAMINLNNAYLAHFEKVNEDRKSRGEQPLKYINPLLRAFSDSADNVTPEAGASPAQPDVTKPNDAEDSKSPPRGFQLNDPGVNRDKPTTPPKRFKLDFGNGT